ncbi:phosphonate C-P lyase system protein PhnH [uncultured Desulfobacter sp.]|uniref:phosphonate C-P lyase system protein PhnH n=1 Tax=uncultured Desulfobacter sp. TaxID=240139 RepID=UPI002AAABD7A|nr:phosphonate C-P lyase system protein PhnH [uncultured Desulfobacter sp.]
MHNGFISETGDSQQIFRKLLTAMAHPGTILDTDLNLECPGSLNPATGAILLTFLDFETTLWSDLDSGTPEIRWICFHTGAPVTPLENCAAFALVTDSGDLEDHSRFNPGTLEAPDHSTTLVIQVQELTDRGRIKLCGPGIETENHLKLTGIRSGFLSQRTRMNENYPLGIDMIFTCGSRFTCLPRTTLVEVL